MKCLRGAIQVLGIKKCDDILIDKEDFLTDIESLYCNGWEVVEISWWKHKLIEDGSIDNDAGGGVRDAANPEYYWAESVYYKCLKNGECIDDIISYYKSCIDSRPFYDLTPAISIKRRKTNTK